MNVVKKIFNVLGILISIVLSLILAVVLLVSPLLSGATALVQTDTLHGMIRQVDFTQLLPDAAEDEVTSALMQTEFANDLVSLCVDDMLAALDGSDQRSLTGQMLLDLAEEHMDELIPIFRPIAVEQAKQNVEVPDGMSVNWDELVTDEDISAAIMQYLSESGEELLTSFPTPEDLGIDQNVAAALAAVRGGALRTAGIVLAAALTVLILLCRWVRFKGFMWAGVVYILFGAVDLAYSFALEGFDFSFLISDIPELTGLVPILLSTLTPALTETSTVIAALGVLFVLIFIVGRIIRKKVRARRQSEETPAPQLCIPAEPDAQAELSAPVQQESSADAP